MLFVTQMLKTFEGKNLLFYPSTKKALKKLIEKFTEEEGHPLYFFLAIILHRVDDIKADLYNLFVKPFISTSEEYYSQLLKDHYLQRGSFEELTNMRSFFIKKIEKACKKIKFKRVKNRKAERKELPKK